MSDVMFTIPAPRNEPVLGYLPGSPEKAELKAALKTMAAQQVEIPLFIDGQEVRTGRLAACVMPHKHAHKLGVYHKAEEKEVKAAIKAAEKARPGWAAMPFQQRAAILLKAADLLAGRKRMLLNAATMLGQSKTAFQAEIDAACELADFLRFNAHYAERIMAEQPASSPGVWNRLDHRPLEGFVYAITPFNFTAIGGNLCAAPALMGNTVVWKPAGTAALSNYLVYRLFEEAGLPPGVINFVPGDAPAISAQVLADRSLAGIHFTGSTAVFQLLWKGVAERLEQYAGYPRLVGETGGKDFIVAHPSADPEALAVAMVRGAYEYQGQKCSAASRAYVPRSLWPEVRDRVLAMQADMRMGDVTDFRNFLGAVIDARAFGKIRGYIEGARTDAGVTILAGGGCDDREGWFIEPTLLEVSDPGYRTMCEEIFGPVLTVHPYADDTWEEMLRLVDLTSPYALTGAVFARDRDALRTADRILRHAAGNYYINDKPTGAVVGQQPFGGGRASGTNDKAGSILNLLRWVSPRTIKETSDAPRAWQYPFMGSE